MNQWRLSLYGRGQGLEKGRGGSETRLCPDCKVGVLEPSSLRVCGVTSGHREGRTDPGLRRVQFAVGKDWRKCDPGQQQGR